MIYVKSVSVILFTILLSGCTSLKQDSIQELFQSHNAIEIKKDYKKITYHLLTFKKKLDLRNPKAYDKEIVNKIYTQINNLKNEINLDYSSKPITSYKNYMQIAFSKDKIINRNDYLVLGLYKNIYEAYDIENSYKMTAFSYNLQKLQTLYHNLEILSWKLKTNKDLEGNYMYLTWQNNWQVELENKMKNGLNPTWQDINNLKHISNNEESVFGYSNFSFENLLLQIKSRVGMSIERLGAEPSQLGINTVKSMFIFL